MISPGKHPRFTYSSTLIIVVRHYDIIYELMLGYIIIFVEMSDNDNICVTQNPKVDEVRLRRNL